MFNNMKNISLLERDELVKTGNIDYAEWNYKPVLKFIQRKRFELCLSLLKNKFYNNLLEIGYGSGIFLPELMKYANNIYGIDVHQKSKEVEKSLMKFINVPKLFSANAAHMPFDDNFFDCIVSVSTIEFIDDLEEACSEIRRILKIKGNFIVITPGHSAIVDIGLKLLTGNSAKKDFEDRRERVIPTITKYFVIKEKKTYPVLINHFLSLYTALKLSPVK